MFTHHFGSHQISISHTHTRTHEWVQHIIHYMHSTGLWNRPHGQLKLFVKCFLKSRYKSWFFFSKERLVLTFEMAKSTRRPHKRLIFISDFHKICKHGCKIDFIPTHSFHSVLFFTYFKSMCVRVRFNFVYGSAGKFQRKF